MEEYADRYNYYLPIQFSEPENEEYREYLISAYLTNLSNEKYQFSFIAGHLMYMTFIYKIIWGLKRSGLNNINNYLSQHSRSINLQTLNNMFDFSVISEKDTFAILRCLNFHQNDISMFSTPVQSRDHCVHASGKIHYNCEEIEGFLNDELRYMERVQKKTQPMKKEMFRKFLEDNWDIENRRESLVKEAFDTWLKEEHLSFADLAELIKVNFDDLFEDDDADETILKKIAFLVVIYESCMILGEDEKQFNETSSRFTDEFEQHDEGKIHQALFDELVPILIKQTNAYKENIRSSNDKIKDITTKIANG